MSRNFRDPIYVKWRKAVYKRDGFRCQWPGCTCKKRLNAHHILPWSKYPTLRYIVDNGITLCKIHHALVRCKEYLYAGLFTTIVKTKKKRGV